MAQSWMPLQLSLLIRISWDPLNWKIWLEEASGVGGCAGKPLGVPLPPLFRRRGAPPREACGAGGRVPGAARIAPQTGLDEGGPGDPVAIFLADSSYRAKLAQPPGPLEFSGHFPHSDGNMCCFIYGQRYPSNYWANSSGCLLPVPACDAVLQCSELMVNKGASSPATVSFPANPVV